MDFIKRTGLCVVIMLLFAIFIVGSFIVVRTLSINAEAQVAADQFIERKINRFYLKTAQALREVELDALYQESIDVDANTSRVILLKEEAEALASQARDKQQSELEMFATNADKLIAQIQNGGDIDDPLQSLILQTEQKVTDLLSISTN